MTTINEFAPGKKFIFVQGILSRSGTNFLHDLLILHPDCVRARSPITEDHLLRRADLLIKYANFLCNQWKRWTTDESLMDLFCRCLGNGAISFFSPQKDSDKRVVTKTASVDNLRYFFKLFPNSHLLILVRDGRSVVQSGLKTWNWNFEGAIRSWAKGAREILQFDQAHKNADFKYLIVRYEDLYKNPQEEIDRILSFLGLDTSTYDFDAAYHLPVRGSSQVSKDDRGVVHWKPIQKTKNFNPLARWNRWSRPMHERFNWIAETYLEQFGYEPTQFGGNRLAWTMWNLLMDVKWLLWSLIRFVCLATILRWTCARRIANRIRFIRWRKR